MNVIVREFEEITQVNKFLSLYDNNDRVMDIDITYNNMIKYHERSSNVYKSRCFYLVVIKLSQPIGDSGNSFKKNLLHDRYEIFSLISTTGFIYTDTQAIYDKIHISGAMSLYNIHSYYDRVNKRVFVCENGKGWDMSYFKK